MTFKTANWRINSWQKPIQPIRIGLIESCPFFRYPPLPRSNAAFTCESFGWGNRVGHRSRSVTATDGVAKFLSYPVLVRGVRQVDWRPTGKWASLGPFNSRVQSAPSKHEHRKARTTRICGRRAKKRHSDLTFDVPTGGAKSTGEHRVIHGHRSGKSRDVRAGPNTYIYLHRYL